MHTRALQALALLLLLLPPLAAALVPDLSADASAGGLTVQVAPTAQPLSAYVVVTYEDELAGDVVERVVPIEVSPELGVELTLDDLRPDVNVTVRVIERQALEALVEDVADLLNGTLVEDLPSLDELDVGRLLPSPLPLDLYAYPFAPLPTRSGDKGVVHPRSLMSPAGVLGAAWIATDFDNASIAEPVLRLSTDLGHRFGPELHLAPGTRTDMSQGSNRGAFAAQVASNGDFLFVTGHDDAQRRLTSYTLARVDPVTQTVTTSNRTVRDEAHFTNYSPLVLPDGTVLIVSHGLRVVRFGADGSPPTVAGLETDPRIGQWSDDLWAHAGPAGAAVAWTAAGPQGPVLRYVRSFDGGRTWTTPANVTGLPGPGQPHVASGAVDDLGVLHLAVLVQQGDVRNELRYVHVPRLAAATVHELPWHGEPIAYASEVFVAAAGGRTWVLGQVADAANITSQAPGAYAIRLRTVAWERLPAPVGWREPQEFKVQQATFRFGGQPTLMPDGRMVVLGDAGIGGYTVVPTFDPFPEPACAAKGAATTTRTPTPGPAPPLASCDERFSLQTLAGAVRVEPVPVGGSTSTTPDSDDVSLPRLDDVPPAAPVGAAALAAAAVVGLASLEAVRYGLGLAAASLFSRVQGKQVLQHAIRAGIHDHVSANPGIRFTQIRKDLELSHGATAYHLRVLERNGLVRARVDWATRHYEATGAAPAAAQVPAHDVILDFLRRSPGAGPTAVARELGISRQLAHYHLRRLQRAGRLPPGPRAGPGRVLSD